MMHKPNYTTKELDIRYVKLDLLQPRKRYDPEKLEELASSLRNEGMINIPRVEEMTSTKYRDYVMQYPESRLKKKLLAKIEDGKKYYLIVVASRRYIGALKAGYNKITAKVTKNLPPLTRRIIQNHEDSQLPFTPWAKAKATHELYQQLKELKEKDGKRYTIKEFSRYTGTPEETVRERLKYVEKVPPPVKKLVEKEKKVKYSNAMLGADFNEDKQLRMALNHGDLPTKKYRKIIQQKPETTLELATQNGLAAARNHSLGQVTDRLYKIMKMREFIPPLKEALKTEQVKQELKKLREAITCYEKNLDEKNKELLKQMRMPKDRCNDTRHYERLEKILDEAYLENERNKLEKDPKIGGGLIRRVRISLIDPDPNNPRGEYEENEMQFLVESIKEIGLQNPILLEKKDGRHLIIAGHRRTEAVKRAGYKTIEAFVVQDLPKELRLYLQVVEDSQVPFTWDERANSWTQLYNLMSKSLKEGTVLTILEFSRRMGKSPSVVGRSIRYGVMLSDFVKTLVEENLLTPPKAQELTRMIENPGELKSKVIMKKQDEIATNAVLGDYSVKEISDAVKDYLLMKGQQELFKNTNGTRGIESRLKEEAKLQLQTLNTIIPQAEANETTLRKICTLERMLKAI